MSKPIKITDNMISELTSEFLRELKNAKIANGTVSFSKNLVDANNTATVFFTPLAWTKMLALIHDFSTEVAWHGVAERRGNLDANEYLVSDILVYPQEVSGANATTDQEAYQDWLMMQPDEVFNNIRFQGHSHVNMSTGPSGVDLTHQGKILDQLEDDMFYIFMIWNKSLKFDCKIYDMLKNTLFETKDVSVQIESEGFDMAEFLKSANAMVKPKVYQPTYGAYRSGYTTPKTTPVTTPATTTKPANTPTNTPAKVPAKTEPVRVYPGVSTYPRASSPEWSEEDMYDMGSPYYGGM